MSDRTALDQARAVLAGDRETSELLLAQARQSARAVEARAELATSRVAELRIQRLHELHAALQSDAARIDSLNARLSEAMEATTRRLADDAAAADFSPPDWQGGLERTVDVRLTEIREVQVTVSGRRSRAA